MNQSKSKKRKRGVILTATGWDKLQKANVLFSRSGERYSLEALSDRAQLDRRTVAKIVSRRQGVDRTTLRLFFESFGLQLQEQDCTKLSQDVEVSKAIGDTKNLEQFPGGPVPLESKFYVERPPVEQLVYAEINNPGSLIRIKAPQKMGKTSLQLRIIEYASKKGYHSVNLDFQQADEAVLASPDKFLRWFCANVARKLGLKSCLSDWDEDIGSKVSCTICFQDQLLEQIDRPLVLCLNEVNRIFEHPQIFREFLPLLRFWYEQGKQDEVFQKLRTVVIHSTEIYIPLNINQSPFNVGLEIELPDFTIKQVSDLAERHGLNWKQVNNSEQLIAMVGGHPYLVRLALYYLCQRQMTLENLLREAPTQAGIYSKHLLSQLANLQEQPELATAYQQVVKAKHSLCLNPIITYKLKSMGLVKLEGDKVTPSCELYRRYFSA